MVYDPIEEALQPILQIAERAEDVEWIKKKIHKCLLDTIYAELKSQKTGTNPKPNLLGIAEELAQSLSEWLRSGNET